MRVSAETLYVYDWRLTLLACVVVGLFTYSLAGLLARSLAGFGRSPARLSLDFAGSLACWVDWFAGLLSGLLGLFVSACLPVCSACLASFACFWLVCLLLLAFACSFACFCFILLALACLCPLLLAIARRCLPYLRLLAFACRLPLFLPVGCLCFCLLLLAFACFCLLLLSFAFFCFLLLA